MPLLLVLLKVSKLAEREKYRESIQRVFYPYLETVFTYMALGDQNTVHVLTAILESYC